MYRICIKGTLDEDWSDRLGGMTVSTTRLGDREAVTSLHGRLVDQASLFGVLNTLYNLHVPILLVEYLDKDAPSFPSDGTFPERVEGGAS